MLADLEIKKFESRDEQEVAGYAGVMETVFAAWQHIPINENHIKQLHRDLLRYSEKDERHRGEYKKVSNSVAAFDEDGKQIGIVFETTTPFDTPRLMAELVAWLAEARDLRRLHPLLIVAVFIVAFLEIHPFQDGNGRLSMRDMVRATGASGNTLKDHFRRLVEKKLLVRHGAGRATW